MSQTIGLIVVGDHPHSFGGPAGSGIQDGWVPCSEFSSRYDEKMQFLRRAERPGRTLALLPGAWNPPTRAHAQLAAAALEHAEEAVFVLPRTMPHKGFDGPPLEVRCEWIASLSQLNPAFSAAVTSGGLFVEMAREARAEGAARVLIVCGADAAERTATWPYPPGSEIERQLDSEFELLVAPRLRAWQPPARLARSVHALALPAVLQQISSTLIRELIQSGGKWEHLVPAELALAIRDAYRPADRAAGQPYRCS